MIGLSTFGSAFIIALGFFDTETEASSIFGVIISIAGAVGTPLGGYLIDLSAKRIQRQAVELAGKERGKFSVAKAPVRTAAMIVTVFSVGGLILMSVTYIILDRWLFLFTICVGCTMLFATTTGINMIIMMSVPERNRPFAIAVNTVCIHAFGDVPSPVFAGLLKDKLAPDCASAEDDNAVSASAACREDSDGIRLTMLIVILWLTWCVLFFSIALKLSTSMEQTLDHLDKEQAENRKRCDSDSDAGGSDVNQQLLLAH